MKKQGKRLLSMIAAMIVVLTTILAPASVAAAEKVDTSKSGSASLVLELPAASDSVKLYQIAEYDSDSKIVMKKEAQDLKVTIDGKESETTLGQKAKTLAGKLKTAAATGKTDAKLSVKFDKLKLGYYLVVVDKCGSDSKKYEVAPVIIGVPAAQKSSWKYDVTVKLKGQEVKATPAPATTTPKAPTSPEKDETVGADDESTTDSSVTPPSPTPTEELTATPTPTEEPTETPTPTETEEPSPTPTEEPTATPTPTEEPTATPTPTETEEPTATPTPMEAETPGLTPTVTATPSVTDELTETPTPSITGEPADTETPPPSVTGEPTDTETPTPSTDFDDSNPDFPSDDSSIPDITVTPDPNMWQMSVTKYWIDKNNLPLSDKDETIPDSLSIQIWKKASAEAKWQKIELVDLTAENGWTYSWTAPDDGATWTVTEDVVPIGFTQMTIKQSKNAKAKTLAFKVTNMSNADVTPAPIQLSICKYWKDKNGNDLDSKEIKVETLPIQIYRKEKDTETWKLYKKVELTADTAWEYHWGAADDGASWTVTERDIPEGYVLQTPIRLAHNAANTKLEFRVTNVVNDGSITLVPTPTNIPITTPTSTPTNTVTPKTPTPTPEIVTYNVVKKWQSESGAQLSASQTGVSSLTVDIYRKSPGATSFTKVETVELLPYDNWAYSWRAADDGSTWTVTEPRIPSGYAKVGITLVKNDTAHTRVFTITNKKTSPGSSVVETSTVTPSPTPEAIGTPTARPVTKMPTATPKPPTPTPTTIRYTIVKKWLTSEGAVLDSSYTGVSSLTIDIYRKQSDETSSIKVGSVELYPSNDWTYSWTTPDDGSTWTVTEPNVPEGYTNVGIVSKSEHAYSRVFTITNKKSSGSPTEPTPTETPTPTLTETPTPTPGTESDDSNPDFPPDESSIPDLTVTPDPNLWQMSVTKYWIDKNNLPLSDKDETIPDSLSIQIWKKASAEAKWQKIELVDLTAENGWTYSWTAPDDGATWTVTEDVVPIGFTQMTIKQSKNAKAKTLAFKVTNMSNADVTPAPIQLSVVKYWKDKNGNDLDDKEISVKSLPIQIYRREKDAKTWKLYKTVELTAETAWEYHWGAADDGATWTVTEREVPEGYTLQTPIKLAHNKDNTRLEFRVTNISASGDVPPTTPPTGTPLTDTPTQTPGTITYSVVKEWQTSAGEFLSASQTGVSSLAVDIYQKKPGAKGYAKVKTVELNSSNSWLYSWTAQDDGSSWTVTEPSEPAGYRKVGITQQKNTNARTCRFTITNRKKAQTPTPTPATISFSVVKKWQSASGAQLSSSQTGVSSLTVDIYRKYPGATSYTKVDSIELLPSNNWTHSWTAKDDGSTWTVTEPHVPSGYTKVGITQSKNDTARTRLFTITNKKTSSGSNSDTNSNTRKVTATATPKVTGSTRNTPNTGDNQNIWIPIMTMFGASVVLVALAKKRAR